MATIPSFSSHKALPWLSVPVQKIGRYFGIAPRDSKQPDFDRFTAPFRTRKLIYEICVPCLLDELGFVVRNPSGASSQPIKLAEARNSRAASLWLENEGIVAILQRSFGRYRGNPWRCLTVGGLSRSAVEPRVSRTSDGHGWICGTATDPAIDKIVGALDGQEGAYRAKARTLNTMLWSLQ